jgi:hypothetical protein
MNDNLGLFLVYLRLAFLCGKLGVVLDGSTGDN